jgi:hypothetical protein
MEDEMIARSPHPRSVEARSLLRGGAGVAAAFILALLLMPGSVSAQASTQLSGTVVDAAAGAGIADVTIRVEGTLLSAVTNADGRFLINDVPVGTVMLRFDHLAYGTHRQEVVVGEGTTAVSVRLSQEAIELEPIEVVGQTTEQSQRRARGSSQWVVDRQEIEEALGTSRHMGDLIRQTIPGVRLRQSNAPTASGNDVCIEFRVAAQISLVDRPGCKSPMVFLDGVPVGNPTLLYDVLPLETIQSIEMLPPAEAGARYGAGSMFGVMLINTRTPGLDRSLRYASPAERSLGNFDWEQDPAGHNTRGVLLGAFAGNAVGLTLGIVTAKQCIAIDAKDEIIATCSTSGTLLAGVAALALPALGGALGARWAGGTETSVGRWVPATASAVLMLVPGYAFSLSTEGGAEADIANVVGGALLAVGVPVLLTVADRLFRDFR